MSSRVLVALLVAPALAACAATTPAPRFAAVGPADAEAPEAVTPPAAPSLSAPPEPAPPAGEAPTPRSGHEGHTAPAAAYSCSMHPEVKRSEPGKCPICGMALVKRAPESPKP